MSRLVVLAGTERLPPGVLPAQVWGLLRDAPLLTAASEHPQLPALDAAGVAVELLNDLTTLPERIAAAEFSVWLPAPGEVSAPADLPAEVIDAPALLPGARLLDVVATMDRLRSPGGCPWDAEQTHESLAPYLLEEAYETVHAIEEGDLVGLREELGDVLLQVAVHSRLAEELPADERFGIDDVAGDLVAKLVRRHPHVFGDLPASTAEEVTANWDRIKAAEKARGSVTEGLPLALPALTLADTLQRRAERLGAPPDLVEPRLAAGEPPSAAVAAAAADADAGSVEAVGDLLMTVVAFCRTRGVDAEAALRGAASRFRGRLAGVEYATAGAAGADGRIAHEDWHRYWTESPG
jgi:XTP/dITP diphosphohydrolase